MEQKEAAKATAAAEAEVAGKEDAMEVEDVGVEGEGKEEEQEGDDSDESVVITRNLDKEMVTPAGKKCQRGELVKTMKDTPRGGTRTRATTTTALHPSSYTSHKHIFPRVITEGSSRLVQEDKVKEFMELIGTLLSNGKMVDRYFAIVSVVMGGGRKDLKEAKEIPANMTLLGGYVKISEKSLRVFERKNTTRTTKGGKLAKGDMVYNNNMIYFTLAITCDVEPREILSGITVEWMRAGGVGLYRKEIQAFNTFSPFVIVYLYNNTAVHTVAEEFKQMMEEAIKLLEEEGLTDD